MYILTLKNAQFNQLPNIFYGPQEIPSWHPLFGKRYWRNGFYRRKLVLYDQRVIFIIIYRFYCHETGKTYSLLPFFISHYERHINTVIEDVVKAYFVDATPVESMASVPSPSVWTIRRWIQRFQQQLAEWQLDIERFLIANLPRYHPTAAWSSRFAERLCHFLSKAEQVPIAEKNLSLYGAFSYLQYTASILKST